MLEEFRVIELTTEVGGALAGRMLGYYGADVIVVEPPEGHAIRSLGPRVGDTPDGSILFAALGAGKRSVIADPAAPDFAPFVKSLLAGADVLIESQPVGTLASAGLDPAALIEEFPGLVVCSISPYGQTGPRAHWKATALTAAAAGGQMAMCGDPGMPPLKTAGYQAQNQAGLHAFSAILAALFAARRTGVGDWIDISMQEVQASTLEGAGPLALFAGVDGGRTAGNRPFAQWGIHECKDGYIGVAAMPRQSFAIYDAIGHPELKDDPMMASGWSPEANEILGVLIPEFTAQYTAEELFANAAKFRAPFAMIPNARQLLEWPGLTATSFWSEVEHAVLGRYQLPGGPIAFGEGWRGDAKPAPLLGEHDAEVRSGGGQAGRVGALASTSPGLPFEGVRVVDVTAVWAGPFGTRFLADLGAEVLKVEGPSFADPIRTMTGARSAPAINQSTYFNEYNRNKLGVSLDIKHPEGMAALKKLIAEADVFVENWSSGVAERLGLGHEDLKKINPRIISVSMPGFGHKGPDAERVGFGPTIEQMGGLVALQGYEGGPPHRSGISYGDPVAGTIGAGAVAMALLHRDLTGEGSYAVTAQRDIICGLVSEYIVAEAVGQPMPTQIGNRDPQFAPHNVYPAADTFPRPMRGADGPMFTDGWLTVAVDSGEAWAGLKSVVPGLENPAWDSAEGRLADQHAIDAVIGAWAADRDAEEAAEALQEAGVPASHVNTPLLVTMDPHLAEREFFLPYSHPDVGDGGTTRPPWRMARRPATTVNPAPRFGEHSREVLARVAGYNEAELDELARKGVTTTDLLAGSGAG
jgi:crotonobetainyl-CoA:carnitine CoA-transferase CaiB-like acyl-CoA transferase